MGERANYLPPEMKARYEELTGDAVDGLEANVRMQQMLETRLWEKVETGESHQAWKVINELVQEYECGDANTQPGTFNRIKQVAQGGLKAYGIQKEILELHERQRRQTETLVKCRAQIQTTYSEEQHGEFLAAVLSILKMRVDLATLRLVAQDIEQKQLLPGGLQEANNGRMVERDIGRLERNGVMGQTIEAEFVGGDDNGTNT